MFKIKILNLLIEWSVEVFGQLINFYLIFVFEFNSYFEKFYVEVVLRLNEKRF